MKYNLSFISDDDLINHVADTVGKYRFKISLEKLNSNLLDPIKLTFDSAIYQGEYSNTALEVILQNEAIRQIDKSNTNHIGYFHQNIFKYIDKKSGWTVPKKGFDIENLNKHIFVEMKNKHNTMNSSSAAKTYMRMQNKLLKDQKAVCYLVEVIAKRSQNIVWKCSLDGEKVEHSNIRRVSIDQFYEIATGDPFAFAKLCKILPTVIRDVILTHKTKLIENTVLDDIKQAEYDSILENLYLLAFKTYQGFENFNLNE